MSIDGLALAGFSLQSISLESISLDSISLDNLALVAAAMFVAAFVKGVTGLGFSTSALPILALSIGVKAALPLLIIPSLTSNLLVMWDAGHFREMLRRFAWLYVGALVGVAVGLSLLVAVEGRVAGAALGLALIAYVAFIWRRAERRLPARLERPLGPVVGLGTGVINGLTGSQVMPALPYLMALGLAPGQLVQAINISFTLSSLVMAAGLWGIGLMTWETALVSAVCVVPVFAGVRLGGWVRTSMAPEVFRRAVLALLGVSGVILVARAAL